VLFWVALFVLSMGLQYVAAIAPSAALAAGAPVVTLESGTNGCEGVKTTPGSENTHKRLTGGSLVPGSTVEFTIDLPVDPADVAGRTTFVITDCVFIDGNAALKYSVSFVPNTVDFVLVFDLTIPAGTPIGAEYCNYAKTTAAPSTSQASNRKAGPACFIVGGNISILKVDDATGDDQAKVVHKALNQLRHLRHPPAAPRADVVTGPAPVQRNEQVHLRKRAGSRAAASVSSRYARRILGDTSCTGTPSIPARRTLSASSGI